MARFFDDDDSVHRLPVDLDIKAQTYLHKSLLSIDEDSFKYDMNIKEILADKQIVAWILKYTVEEFKNFEIEKIMACINGDISIMQMPVDPGLSNSKIAAASNENRIANEGVIYFDIVFDALYGDNAEQMCIIINIEAQNKTKPGELGYPLENRIIYYLARLISSQKDNGKWGFTNTKYGDIKKVRSIWLYLNEDKDGDSIDEIYLKQRHIHGDKVILKNLDLMQAAIVRLRSHPDKKSANALIAMLEKLLSKQDIMTKEHDLERDYGLKFTIKMKERLNGMGMLGTALIEQGLEQGLERGIRSLAKFSLGIGQEYDETRDLIIKEYPDVTPSRIDAILEEMRG